MASIGGLSDAYRLVLETFNNLATIVSEKSAGPSGTNANDRLHFVSLFMHGEATTRDLILHGAYHQAAALLRQELELVSAVREHELARFRTGKVNVQNAVPNLKKKYADLSKLTHPTQPDLIKGLTSHTQAGFAGPSIVPRFNGDLCRSFFGDHIFLFSFNVFQADRACRDAIGCAMSGKDAGKLKAALEILIKEGCLKT